MSEAGQLAVGRIGQGRVERPTTAPRARSRRSTARAGESRRSSVAALNVRPQAATVRSPAAGAGRLAHLVRDQVELALVGGHHLLEQSEVVAVVLGDADQGAGVLGEARAAPAGPGARWSAPMRRS